jgi:DNA-binding LacI/PurR family transcriptional regulator
MSVTIYDIAKRSSSTVARVLRGDMNDSFQVSAAPVTRFRRWATEMGYRHTWQAPAFAVVFRRV